MSNKEAETTRAAAELSIREAETKRAALARVLYERRAEGGSVSFQRRVFDVLSMPSHDPWISLINSKLSVFGIEDCVLSLKQWKESMTSLKICPQGIETCFIKTVINFWATSHRLSESGLLPCISGCQDCEDNLEHYLGCEPLGPWPCVPVVSPSPSSLPLPGSASSTSPLLASDFSVWYFVDTMR